MDGLTTLYCEMSSDLVKNFCQLCNTVRRFISYLFSMKLLDIYIFSRGKHLNLAYEISYFPEKGKTDKKKDF